MQSASEKVNNANKPYEESIRLHGIFRGKMQTVPRCVIRNTDDFAYWYSPGVAAVCKEIQKNPADVYKYTSKWNTVAVVSDCTRVLGIGDIGPAAGLPVMEGKALLFKYLGGVDAVPICLDTTDASNIIQAVKWLQPAFGGINLEDIASPKCFRVLDQLRQDLSIPVWHDDQQGTAVVTLAGLINSMKIVGKTPEKVKIALIGVGSANIAISRLLSKAGYKLPNMIFVDSRSILHKGRDDIRKDESTQLYKWDICLKTNGEQKTGGIAEALEGADICLALSKPGPDTIRAEWVSRMAKNAIIFACANPTPEIWPWAAKEAGARIVATGRSDFPNQVNNSLVFPAVFRGALDVRASTITDEMCLAAAQSLAGSAGKNMNEDNIIPGMGDWEVFIKEAVAVGLKAIEQGIASQIHTAAELTKMAEDIIRQSRSTVSVLMKEGLIPNPDNQ